MRKSVSLLFLLVAVSVFATTLTLPRILSDAVRGERMAAARYDAFAKQADSEGYAGVACLFRAQAKAERIHEQRFVKLMNERGISVPGDGAPSISASSTERNLEAAVAAEQAERDSTYLYAINTCNECNDAAAAKVFDMTRDTETEHANLCAAAKRNLNAMKKAQPYYLCPICGYTTEIHLPFCPSCGKQEELDRVD